MISNPEARRVAEGVSRLLTAMAARRAHARLLALPFAGTLTLERDGRCALSWRSQSRTKHWSMAARLVHAWLLALPLHAF